MVTRPPGPQTMIVRQEVARQDATAAPGAIARWQAARTQPILRPDHAFALDHAAWTSLTGAHARLAETTGGAVRYPADVSPFAAIEPNPRDRTWRDLAALAGRGALITIPGLDAPVPAGWDLVESGDGVQMIDTSLRAAPHPDVIPLGPADVPDMLDLTARTKPGPFLPRTIEMGTYLGIRRGDVLVAMAGQRLHPPGWIEISAVCSDPAHRGQGLATRLVQAVAAEIRQRGCTPFLHALASNSRAIRLYESLGFTVRRTTRFLLVRAPDADRST